MKTTTLRILTAFALSASVLLPGLFAQSGQRTAPASQTYPSHPVAVSPAQNQQTSRAAAEVQAPSRPARVAQASSAAPAAAPARQVAQPQSSGGIGSRFDSNLYTVEKTLLSSTQVGEEYQYRLRVTALEDITKIHVVEHLPEGLEFVRATPGSSLSNGNLSWNYASLAKGESLDHVITVKPTREARFLTSSMVCVDPIVILPIEAGAPRLALVKTGPANAELGSPIPFVVTVTNNGTAPARDVVVTDTLPSGLNHASGNREIVTEVGTLAAGESKQINIPLTASARGTFTNVARVTSTNTPPSDGQAVVSVVQSKLGLTKTGPSTEYVFKNATYTITATNEGDTTLTDVNIIDELPRGTTLISGGDARNGRLAWNVPSLAPGQSANFDVTLTTTTPGSTTNSVTARASNGTGASASATTMWEGAPGVLTELIDTKDPIRVGESTVYEIRITNQGTLKPVTSAVKVVLSANLRATSATGDAQGIIEGATINFPEVIIPPRGSIKLRVPAEAIAPGIGKARLEFMSSFLTEPLIKEESTFVY
jgi:uncharacterized repeat protein (TIGR01451 family)